MTALTPFHTAREAGETCAQRRHGKGQARPVKLNREYLGSLWAGHQQDSRSHAWQCTKAQIPPGKSNERGRWFESTSKALSHPPPHPNPTQKVSQRLGRKLNTILVEQALVGAGRSCCTLSKNQCSQPKPVFPDSKLQLSQRRLWVCSYVV